MKKIEFEVFTGEHNKDFIHGMLSRMDMSYAKYGSFRRNSRGQYHKDFTDDLKKTLIAFLERWDHPGASSTTANGNNMIFLIRRLVAYLCGKGGDTPGNTEYLMDAANGLMIEFDGPQVPGAHFHSTDEKGSTGFAGISEKEMEKYR